MEEIEDIKGAVKARCAAEEAAAAATGKEEGDGITPQFIRDCLQANEAGDGALFAALHRGRFLFNKTASQWYRWAGHHWESDIHEKVFLGVEDVACRYLTEVARLSEEIKAARTEDKQDLVKKLKEQQGRFYRRIKRLRSTAGAQNCQSWSHRVEGALSVSEEAFDKRAWLLALKNGVVELATGRFRPGRPEDHLTKAVPHKWVDIDCPAPVWEKFLDDVFDGKEELTSYVQRLFGYGITGVTSEHILPVLHGNGRNGKGTLVETLRYVLGPLAQPIQSEMLLDQRSARASSGPSPDIMALKGLRLAFASETDEGRKFSTSKAKLFSGGDTLTGRNPHDRYETTFEPTHLLCLLTNHLPHAPGDDFAFWQRIHLVPFDVHFIDNPQRDKERPRDKELPEKLKAEAPGILAWLVRGCIEWQRQGLNPPAMVRFATEKYRVSEDTIAEFVEACCYPPEETLPDARTQFKSVYDAFERWYGAAIGDTKYCPKKRKFGQLMERRFEKRKVGSQIWFFGIELRPDGEMDE